MPHALFLLILEFNQEGQINMASYHMTADIVSRGKDTPTTKYAATKAAAYRSGERIVDQRNGKVWNYTKRRDDVLHSNILAPQGAENWVYDRSALANKIEFSEHRVDSQLIRSLEGALPEELTLDQQIEIVEKLINNNFVKEGMVADYSIHMKPDEETGHPNPHVHIGLTMRRLDGDGFYRKKERNWNDFDDGNGKVLKNEDKTLYKGWRKYWADIQNEYLEKHGHTDRVDHRSYEEQGIDKIPTKHEGKHITAQKRKGFNVDKEGESYDMIDENGFINHINTVIETTRDLEPEEVFYQEIVEPEQSEIMDADKAKHYETLRETIRNTTFLSESDQISRFARFNAVIQKTIDSAKSIRDKIFEKYINFTTQEGSQEHDHGRG